MKYLKKGRITSGANISYWISSEHPISFNPLQEDLATDVVIVGGGIAGLSIAYNLLKSGKKVVLVEDGNIGSGETGHTTAHLVTALDDRYFELERMHGEEHIKLVAESHQSAIDFIEHTIKEENIQCDFERLNGYLFLDPTDQVESLSKEYASATKAGLKINRLQMVPGLISEPIPCLQFENQAQFHPMKYLKGLCNAVIKMGGSIYTDTHAKKINHEGISTDKGFKINAEHVVVATNSPVNNKYVMHLKQYAYRSYVIGARIPKDSIKKALWWDTGDRDENETIPPYHYVRIHSLNNKYDLLICGGEDHPTGVVDEGRISEEDRYALLEYWVRERFNIIDVVYQWSGQVMEPMDSLAYIGHNPMDKDNVYIVTGDSGNGLTHGTIASLLITDLINGRENKWEKIYTPSRFRLLSAGKTFFKELIGGMMAYLKHKPKDVRSVALSSIKSGEGKIVALDNNKVGAYRDDEDTLHIVDAECTQLGCMVKWNNDEKTWDCPCHGSRFTHAGEVVNGPANTNLPYHKVKELESLEKELN